MPRIPTGRVGIRVRGRCAQIALTCIYRTDGVRFCHQRFFALPLLFVRRVNSFVSNCISLRFTLARLPEPDGESRCITFCFAWYYFKCGFLHTDIGFTRNVVLFLLSPLTSSVVAGRAIDSPWQVGYQWTGFIKNLITTGELTNVRNQMAWERGAGSGDVC
jgi:hypothetical protein